MIEIKDNGTKACELHKNEEDSHLLQHENITVDTNDDIASEHDITSKGTFSRSHIKYLELQNISVNCLQCI
jgi:hypothetical protein